jgi:hypothetical protein
MKIKTAFKFNILLFALAVLPFSIRGQMASADTTLVSSDDHFVAYRVDGDNVIFTVEFIADFTDNSNGVFPDVDFVNIAVDVNQNGSIDSYLDKSYGKIGKRIREGKIFPDSAKPLICTQFMITVRSSTACGGMKSKAALDFNFQSTEKALKPHPVYQFTIPRTELSADGKSAHIKLHLYSAGKGSAYYPEKEPWEDYHSFINVLKIQF